MTRERFVVTSKDGAVIEEYQGITELEALDEYMNRLGLDMAGKEANDD